MSFEYDEKGKFFTEVVTKVAVAAVIQTTTHLLRGNIHVRPDQRLKDELDQDDPFLAVTEVSVFGQDEKLAYSADFILVRRNQIVWVMPDESKKMQGEK